MNAIHDLFDSIQSLSPLERMGWVLVQSFWQGAVAAIVLAITLAVVRSARTRYAAACAAMTLIASAFLITATVAFMPPVEHPDWANTAQTPSDLRDLAPTPTLAPPGPVPPAIFTKGFARTGLRSMSCAWLCGVAAMSAWNAVGWVGVQRLRRRSLPPPSELDRRLSNCARALRINRRVRLAIGANIDRPALVGWLRPVILMPAGVLTGLPPSQIEALFLHELAHIRRHDYLFNLIQTAIETALFYHPAAWWVGVQVRRERENCCDDLAATRCGSRLTYARALAAAAELQGASTPALALGCDGGILARRIERILAVRISPRRTSAIGSATLLAASFGLLSVLYHPFAQAADSAASAQSLAASRPSANDAVRPEDLKAAQPRDYTVGPEDLLAVTISDLRGPNSETLKQCRISATGNLSLPYLNAPIHAAGLSEFEVEQAIVKAYRAAELIEHANVSVTVIEARGREYDILGAVENPHQYTIWARDTRLLDAVAEAGGTKGNVSTVRILREAQANDPGRTIDIDGPRLLAGEASLNIVVRPRDTIVVIGGENAELAGSERVVRLVVGKDTLMFQSKSVTWEQLPAELQKVSDRAHTVLELSAQFADVPVGRYFEARRRAGELVAKLGFKSLIQVEVRAGSAP